MKKKILLLGLVFSLIGFALVGCNTGRSTSVIGSTSVSPLAQELADAFNEKEKGIRINVQGVGSTAGVRAVKDGSGDIGIVSRNLKSAEKEWKLKEHLIANDGIAIIVNPKNPISKLTKQQITDIYQGKIKNWNELGGIDKEIIVVSREDGSGTRGAFDELAKIEVKKDGQKISLLIDDALIAEGNGSVKSNVNTKENAIGYVSMGYIDEKVKGILVNDIEPTAENVKSGKYEISRPFLMLTNGEMKTEVKMFLDFIKSEEGQKIVAKKYISIN